MKGVATGDAKILESFCVDGGFGLVIAKCAHRVDGRFMRVSVMRTSSDVLHQQPSFWSAGFLSKHWITGTSPTHSYPSNHQHYYYFLHQHSLVDVSRVTILPVSMTTTCCCPPLICLCPPYHPPTQLPPTPPILPLLCTLLVFQGQRGAKTDAAIKADILEESEERGHRGKRGVSQT